MSLAEILVISIIALLVLGPKQLPQIAKIINKLYRLAQQFMTNAQTKLDEQLKLQQLHENQNKARDAEKQYQQKASEKENKDK